jgi:dienelactone hydrolase
VENIQGAVMLLSGDQDKVWPAADMGDRIIQRLQAHNFPYYYQHIVYADAGHAVFVGGPSDPGQFSRLQSFYGGTNEGNSTAWQDSWEQGYTFFETYLK